LPAKLAAEASGILTWAVQGCLEWQHRGLGTPDEVRAATEGYRAEMDLLAAFISDRCVLHQGATVTAKALYEAYRSWCEETGERPSSQKALGLRLQERQLTPTRIGKDRTRGWVGIGLADQEHQASLGADTSPTSPGGGADTSTKYSAKSAVVGLVGASHW
jgi:putative DNA primase/helicase